MTTVILALNARADQSLEILENKGSISATSTYLDLRVSLAQPQFLRLSVDSLGLGQFPPSSLRQGAVSDRPTVAQRSGNAVTYCRVHCPRSRPGRWTFQFEAQDIVLTSRWSTDDPPEPVVLEFDPRLCHATLLGHVNSDGSVRLPAVMHLPDQGTFRITARDDKDAILGYDARRVQDGYVRISFPPAGQEHPKREYRLQVTAIYPPLAGIEKDPRFDGFRRNWLNILQINPRLRALANHAASDTCAFCYYEYADIARQTPALAEGLGALEPVRQSLQRMLEGAPAYGMPGYAMFDGLFTNEKHPVCPFPEPSLDTYPSMLIAVYDYVAGTGDYDWLKKNYAGIRQWAEKMLATDTDGNGLIKFHLKGNLGDARRQWPLRPANWWDDIGFGHEDAYSNALAYRALCGMIELANGIGQADDASRYRATAEKLRKTYFPTFYNPASGVLAGWKSADGQLHDYYFLFVNGIAIHYGLVPKDQANAIMDKLLAKMSEVGYSRFDLGLPGNLVAVPQADYNALQKRWGGGPDGFQVYENGGATACFAYFTLAALYDLGRRDEADRILFPLLQSFAKGGFQGGGPNGMSYDWKTWEGVPWGYEGFLVDNYYTLLAVLARENQLNKPCRLP